MRNQWVSAGERHTGGNLVGQKSLGVRLVGENSMGNSVGQETGLW